MTGVPGQHEKMVAESIEVFQHDGFDIHPLYLHLYTDPFGTAAYAAGYMRSRDGYMSTRQDKRPHFGQDLIHPVYFFLQCFNIFFSQIGDLHF